MNKVRALSFTCSFVETEENLYKVNSFYFRLFDELLRKIRERSIDNEMLRNKLNGRKKERSYSDDR